MVMTKERSIERIKKEKSELEEMLENCMHISANIKHLTG